MGGEFVAQLVEAAAGFGGVDFVFVRGQGRTGVLVHFAEGSGEAGGTEKGAGAPGGPTGGGDKGGGGGGGGGTSSTTAQTGSTTSTSSSTTSTTAPATTLDFSLPAVHGSTALAAAFTPDPFTVGVTAGVGVLCGVGVNAGVVVGPAVGVGVGAVVGVGVGPIAKAG